MGRIAWVRPTYGMIHRMLVNPTYAGAFVYGRCRQEVSTGDPPTVAERRLPPEEWAIVVQGVYPGYISYDTFLANRRQLHGNRYNFEAKGRGAPREGTALLQGLVRCGRCGQQMGVSYGRQQPRYQCRRAQTDLALAGCQSFLAGEIDATVVASFLDAVRPAGLEATLAALRDLEEERRAVERQWQLRLERARYETRLARRQYDAVDPDNRLVARELERRWEAALAEVERLEQDHERMRRTELRPLEPAEMADVRRLAADLPALWHADTTLPADRKRLLRLVIAAVTVTVAGDRRAAEVVILWSGGATTRHHVVGRPFGWHLRTEAEMLALIRDLAEKMPDHQVAAALAGLGLCTRHRKSWTRARVASMRRQHGIPTACPTQTGHQTCRADGLVPARVAGERLGMTLAAIRVWAHRGILPCDQSSPSAKLWARLTPEDIERVGGEADVAGMPRVREVAAREGVASADVWARVRSGELVAYRAPRGRGQWEWRLAQRALPNAIPSVSALLPLPSERTA